MLTSDFEEFTGKSDKVSRHIEKCNTCVYKNASPSEGWCYLFANAPDKPCVKYVIARGASEGAAILALGKAFPDKFGDE